jgi:hypothetical protein
MSDRASRNQVLLALGSTAGRRLPATVSFCNDEVLALYFDSIDDGRDFAGAVGLRVSEPYFHEDLSRRQVGIGGTYLGWTVSGSAAEPVPVDERERLLAERAVADDPEHRETPQHFGELERRS